MKEMQMNEAQKQFNELKKQIGDLEASLNQIKNALNKLDKDALGIDYTQLDGEVGVFDGKFMVKKDGTKIEVPINYAAKSKLVHGDTLKMVEENGKKLFKQIVKVERKKMDGILTRKEGEWYILTDRGSYKVSDVAAQFQNAQLNSQATAFLPADNLDAPFATIDEVEGFNQNRDNVVKTPSQDKPKEHRPVKKAPVTDKNIDKKPVKEDKKEVEQKPRPVKKPVIAKEKPVAEKKNEVSENLDMPSAGTIDIDSDDLV